VLDHPTYLRKLGVLGSLFRTPRILQRKLLNYKLLFLPDHLVWRHATLDEHPWSLRGGGGRLRDGHGGGLSEHAEENFRIARMVLT
jgi:hypothetical protein